MASMVNGHPERRRKYKKITISGFKIFLLKQTKKTKKSYDEIKSFLKSEQYKEIGI
jgi:hypothetical protein